MQCNQEVYHPFQRPPPGYASKQFVLNEMTRLTTLMANMSEAELGGWEQSKFAVIVLGYNDGPHVQVNEQT